MKATLHIPCAIAAIGLGALQALAQPQAGYSITALGGLPGGPSNEWWWTLSRAQAIDARGTTVVGTAYVGPGESEWAVFRWTRESGMVALPVPIGSTVAGLRGDGRVVAGTTADYRAFLWREWDGVQLLPIPATSTTSKTSAISRDGTAIVGALDVAGWQGGVAVKWSGAPEPHRLQMPPHAGQFCGGEASVPLAVNANGTVIGGLAPCDDTHDPVAWNFAGDPWLGRDSHVAGISDSGDVLVATPSPYGQGFWPTRVWYSNGQFIEVPTLVVDPFIEHGVHATCISGDGTVVGGEDMIDQSGFDRGTAIIWSRAMGTRSVAAILSAANVDLSHWQQLHSVTGVSADGRIVCGNGLNVDGDIEAFVATLGNSCIADMDDGSGLGIRDEAVTIDDLLQFLRYMEHGDPRGDVFHRGCGGVDDGAITVDDLLCFFSHFEMGC